MVTTWRGGTDSESHTLPPMTEPLSVLPKGEIMNVAKVCGDWAEVSLGRQLTTSGWVWLLPHSLIFAVACLHMGVLVYRRRNRSRS